MANHKTTKEQESAPVREPATRSEMGTRELIVRKVHIQGLTEIMFDRYAGDNETQLEPWQKLYLGGDGREICLPSANVISFLSAQNTDSAPKRLLDSRKYKKFAQAALSYIVIAPVMIPFIRNGAHIRFGKLVDDHDAESGVYVHRSVARLEKGIPNPKVRPVLPLPWELHFELKLFPNRHIQEAQVLNLIQEGLLSLGLGTFRGQYGKAQVALWE